MSIFLYPSEYYDSTYSINFKKYYNLGYRGIIFDIDNTLVPHNAMHDERSRRLFKKLNELGYKICFVSNNKEPRVKEFNKEVGGYYIYKAGKPKKKGFIEAMKKMNTTRENTLFVGDQLFTDIWGANNAKLHSILVKPIDKKEEIQIVLKRYLEYPILKLYLINHKLQTRH
ncbi:MAG: YqeG family HAD IIIA-type phosphatase [Eubacterium sp.]|nr:YqeG family HAD IIIA-type phosphatase [Eubacterium sp.]